MSKYLFIIIFILLLAGWFYVYKSHQDRFKTTSKKTLQQTQNYKDITGDRLYEMLKNKDFYFVNVHTPYEGEIEKTDAFIPYDEIENNLNKLPKDKNDRVVLYCRSGRMSAEASQKLADLGYTNILNLFLGMHDWQSKGYRLKNAK